MRRLAVVGGGVSGLAAALALQDAADDQALEIHLFEAGPRFGGVLQSERRDGHLLELGPDSLVITKPLAIKMAERLGVELVPTDPLLAPHN